MVIEWFVWCITKECRHAEYGYWLFDGCVQAILTSLEA